MIEADGTIMLPSQITPQTQTETNYTSSQSVTGSSQSRVSNSITLQESQPVLSVAEARMSEFIEVYPPVQTENIADMDPLGTEPPPTHNPSS